MRLTDRRIGLLFAAFFLIFTATAGRAIYLHTAEAGHLKRLATGQQEEQLKLPDQRGRITDRNGEILATNKEATTVIATPYLVKSPTRTARLIAPHLNSTIEDILPKLADNDSGFVYLARQVDPDRASRIKKLEIEGIDFIDEPMRQYPQGSLAGQLLGVVGTDGKGLLGMEFAHDKSLRGLDGEQRVVKDARGDPISLIETRKMKPGEDVQLTIDAVVQARVESVLAEAGRKQQAKRAMAIVMNPKTGEILAMASWPRIDPNKPGKLDGSKTANLPTNFTYEPGSTFKPFTVGAALEGRVVTPETTISVGSELQVYDRVITNAGKGPGCSCSVATVLARSINTATAKIGMMVGRKRFDRTVSRFGFGRTTGIDLPGEEQGLLLEPEEYSGPTLANMAIGQGLSVTPIQLATAFSAIANGGVLRPPHIVRSVAGNNTKRKRGRRIIKPKTAADLRKMLEGVLGPDGTAKEAKIPGYEIGGKTGTAEKVVNGQYSRSAYVASFAGFVPVSDPEVFSLFVFDEPAGQFGGTVAAPAFEKAMSFVLTYLGVRPK